LAIFCWTKSLLCKDVLVFWPHSVFGQGFCKDAVNRDSTIQSLQVRRIQVPCQPSGRSNHPVQSAICTLFHPSGRRVIPSGQPDRPSIIHPDDVPLRPNPPLCREGSIQLASVQTFQQHVWTPLSTRSVSDFFPSSKKGKINQPSGYSIPSGCASP